MYTLGRGSRRSINIWPGFVDGLATLLMVVIFVLMVFMVAQYVLTIGITGRDEALGRLEREINDLAELLSLERSLEARDLPGGTARSRVEAALDAAAQELQAAVAALEEGPS